MMECAIFSILALMVVVPALLMVTVKNVFHSALWLILCLSGVAGMYAMLAADFVFAVQLLVYVGGVMVLLLFVVLLSGKPSDWADRQINDKAWGVGLFSIFMAAALTSTILEWHLPNLSIDAQATTGRLGQLLMNEMVLPMEVISLVLVAALVGAVYFSVKKSS